FIEKTDEGIKIYFSTRNSENKSQIGWILVDNKNLFKILKISKTPLLKLGDIGFFDYDGTMGCQIINVNEKKILYYIGWNLGVAVPFRNAIGAAFYDSIKNKFIKISEGPLIDRNIYDKCFVSSNCVIKDKKKYRMYYQSCSKWEYKNDELQHYYNIKYAESLDGINWIIRGHTAIDFKYPMNTRYAYRE
ncbi:MAG: hypothetical protein ABI840_11170, partial [bacterium]